MKGEGLGFKGEGLGFKDGKLTARVQMEKTTCKEGGDSGEGATPLPAG